MIKSDIWCQFCDKPLLLGAEVKVLEYTTCGSRACKAKAIKNHHACNGKILDKARLIVHRTATPEDCKSWEVLKREDYPELLILALSNYDLLAQTLQPGFVFTLTQDHPYVYTVDKQKDVAKHIVNNIRESGETRH